MKTLRLALLPTVTRIMINSDNTRTMITTYTLFNADTGKMITSYDQMRSNDKRVKEALTK